MAWFEFHAQVLRHRKTLRLASRLDVSRSHAAGILACLWGTCIEQAEDGDLSDIEPGELEYWTDYPDGERLLAALVDVRWLDRDGDKLTVHDWHDYAGKYVEKRKADAGRKRRSRRAHTDGVMRVVKARDHGQCQYCGVEVNWRDRRGAAGGTYDHIDPQGEDSPENLVVACRACNAGKGCRTPEDAGMPLISDPRPGRKPARSVVTGSATHPPTHSTNKQNPPTRAPARAPACEATADPKVPESVGGVGGLSRVGKNNQSGKQALSCLLSLSPADLSDASRLEAIVEQGKRDGDWAGAERDRVFIFAAAARAAREGDNPPALFRRLVERGGPITQADEDAGRLMMKRAQGQDVREPKKKQRRTYNPAG